MRKGFKGLKSFIATILLVSMVFAFMGSASAATPDDWNIATYTGIKTLTNANEYSPYGATAALNEDLAPVVFSWGEIPAGKADYRFYRIMSDDSVKRLKSVGLDVWTIVNGGEYAYQNAYATPVTTGFPTGEYVGVYRYTDMNNSLVMERNQTINIVNTLQQVEGHMLSGSRQVTSDFTFFSPTKSDHTGRTGSYKVTSPSGTVIQSATFTLGANLISDTDHTKFKSQKFTTPSFSGYLNGTYKITYSYVAGGSTYTDSLNLVISGGYVTSVTEL